MSNDERQQLSDATTRRVVDALRAMRESAKGGPLSAAFARCRDEAIAIVEAHGLPADERARTFVVPDELPGTKAGGPRRAGEAGVEDWPKDDASRLAQLEACERSAK